MPDATVFFTPVALRYAGAWRHYPPGFFSVQLASGPGSDDVVWHALHTALNPVVTAISGWLAKLLAASFFVAYVSGWKGIKKITVDVLDKFDLPALMGSVLLTATFFIVVNIFTDLVYARLQPLVRL